MPIRILLVDDSVEFLGAATRFLATKSHLQIIGQALSGSTALDQIAALKPELVLMDIALPGGSGLEVTRMIKMQPEAPRVVILTLYDHPEYRAAAAAVNADGFVAKSDFGDQLLSLIHVLFELDTDHAP